MASEFQKAIDGVAGDMTEKDRSDMKSLLERYKDIFVDKTGKLGFTSIREHHIRVKEDAVPFAARPYRCGPQHKKIIDD